MFRSFSQIYNGNLKWLCHTHCFIGNAQLKATVNCSCWSICTFHDVLEISHVKPFQNSVLWRAAECHYQVAEFLLHIFVFKRRFFIGLLSSVQYLSTISTIIFYVLQDNCGLYAFKRCLLSYSLGWQRLQLIQYRGVQNPLATIPGGNGSQYSMSLFSFACFVCLL